MDNDGINKITSVLQVVYSAKTTNEERREAQKFLESVKAKEESPYWGYQLALPELVSDTVVRHFGLSLLQHSINHRFHTFDAAKVSAVRNWIVELAGKVTERDPHFLKEKLAFLWVAVAKRIWGAYLIKGDDVVSEEDQEQGWVNMDRDLWRLWDTSETCRVLALVVMRTLFEDIYLLDDVVASKRVVILNQLSVLIVTPQNVLDQIYEHSPNVAICKHTSQGWFATWSQYLVQLMREGDIDGEACQMFVPKILSTFKTCLHWVQPAVLRSENIMYTLVDLLSVHDVRLKTLAVDCLHILFTRSYSASEDFDFFIGSIFSREGVARLAEFYHSLEIDPDDIDEQVYALLKKTVEMIVSLSEYLNVGTKNKVSWEEADISSYLRLVLNTTNHASLIISGLSLQMWVTILRLDELSSKPQITDILTDLLECAANKTINYSSTSDEPESQKYLAVDFDSAPDATAFLQNYKKFNEDIVRISVCKQPERGLQWLEARLEAFFSSALGHECINQYKLHEKSSALNYGTAQFTIIENCIRGISRWRIWYTGDDFDAINDRLNKLVESLGERLLAMSLASPLLIRKQVQTMVQFAPLLKDVSPLMFQVLEKILTTATFEYPEGCADDERELIRDLRTSCGTELNRLAYIMPESLKKIFDDLETVVANILSSKKVSDHEVVSFKSFLLVIASRSSIVGKDRLFAKIVDPELSAWSSPDTIKGLSDLHWFMERIGIVQIADYFQRRGISATSNLLDTPMDDEGKRLKNTLKDHWSSIFPIRATRIFMQYSIEKLAHDSPEYINLLKLWKPRVQPVVPHILQLLTQIQAYHNPANWTDLPAAVQSFVKYSTTERFWHQGVSIQSKETFIEESVKAALTLRDFADSVGHLVRYTREYAFLTIGSLSQLEDTFYEVPGIATMLWKAVAGDTVGVTLHSWKHMINSCLRSVVKFCPVKFVDVFMAELLPMVFRDLDALLVARWDKVYTDGLQLKGNEDDETLSEEMMEEHMLRQLTATIVRLLMDVASQFNAKSITDTQFATRRLIIDNQQVMEPFLRICCHIISFKDTKCSFNTILVLRNVLQDIVLKDDDVDRYICDNLIKALLHVLMDDYFVETHGEAAVALATVYCALRSKNDYPAQILSRYLPNISAHHIGNFERLLVSSKCLKHQRSAILELVRISRDGSVDDDDMSKRKKQLEVASAQRKKKTTDMMNDPFVENGALENLFDNN